MVLVSVIISTYNRYQYLLKAIESVKNQTHQEYEIIVVNDGSIQKEYYENEDIDGVTMIHLKRNSRDLLGFPCMSLPKNVGVAHSTGQWIAFLDDDDYWLPNKLEIQLQQIERHNNHRRRLNQEKKRDPRKLFAKDLLMCSTDAYFGKGMYNPKKKYKRYIKDQAKQSIMNKTKMKRIPEVFNEVYIAKCNAIIMSSCIFHVSLIKEVSLMDLVPLGGKKGGYYEDWEYWKRMLKHTNCLYVNMPLIYYDVGHGNGKEY